MPLYFRNIEYNEIRDNICARGNRDAFRLIYCKKIHSKIRLTIRLVTVSGGNIMLNLLWWLTVGFFVFMYKLMKANS